MGYEKILIPLDGSELAEVALIHLGRVTTLEAKVHLISVMTEVPAQVVALTPQLSFPDPHPEVQARETYLNTIADGLRQSGYETTTEVRTGRVVDAIAEIANDGFDLVIIATHRRHGLSKFILGSVSETLLHDTHCPVLIV